MEISSILVMSLVIILMLMILVFSMELLIPIQLKFEMNGICRSYIYKIESNGDLTSEEKSDFTDAIEKLGLKDLNIKITKDGSRYGDKVVVSISSVYNHNRLIDVFNRKKENMVLKYERIYYIRKIEN
ncbi:MAG: DUF4320 family protein [Clostridiales bacterium]|nr:DUF4320 family protein [Clostridiales bacterium]